MSRRTVRVIEGGIPEQYLDVEPLQLPRTTVTGRRRRPKIPPAVRLRVYKKYNYTCNRCKLDMKPGSPDEHLITIDHIKPLSKQGKNHFKNMQVLCKSCNEEKGNSHGFVQRSST